MEEKTMILPCLPPTTGMSKEEAAAYHAKRKYYPEQKISFWDVLKDIWLIIKN